MKKIAIVTLVIISMLIGLSLSIYLVVSGQYKLSVQQALLSKKANDNKEQLMKKTIDDYIIKRTNEIQADSKERSLTKEETAFILNPEINAKVELGLASSTPPPAYSGMTQEEIDKILKPNK